jgi:hemerythrin
MGKERLMVWYGMHKVGVPDIDIDHANIDTYLQLMNSHGLNPGNFQKLIEALLAHFSKEEEVSKSLDLNFTKEHEDEHRRLAEILEGIKYEEKSPQEHLLFFKQTLMAHINEFDIHLV